MNNRFFHSVLWMVFLSFLFCGAASASDSAPLNPDRNEPLEITADGALEWQRDGKQMVAKGNAKARQGDVSVSAAVMTADYRDKDKGGMEIWRLTAAGDVRIKSADSEAYGDQAIYDLDRGVAVMTGKNLRLMTPEQTVTAKESFEYWIAENRMKAIGGARVVRGGDRLDSDTLSAIFAQNAKGSRTLDHVEAAGHVVITTPTERAEGDSGVYDAKTQIATLTGNVRLTRGPNVLEGTRAEVNLATHVSRLLGGGGSGTGGESGRVRGVFFPGSDGGTGGDAALSPDAP